MADISILSRLINGFQRNVDVSQNALVVGSLKVGSSTPVEITKAIATKLIAVQAAADADGTYDTRYYTKSQLNSTTSTSGAKQIGVNHTASNYTAGTQDVEAHIVGIDTALAGAIAGSGQVKNTAADTTSDYLNNKITVTAGLTKTTTSPGGNEKLNLAVDPTVYVAVAQKGANNGVATLDGGGKIPVAQLPNAVMTYEGLWNAATNTPTLTNGTGDAGQVYRVSAAGSVNFGAGAISFDIGDYVIYSGSVWEKSDGTDAVNSVNGQQGIVVLTTSDIAEGSNLYFNNERAQDAVGGILTDTATIDFTYDDAGNAITADVKDNSIGNAKLTTGVADQNTITGGNGSALAVNNSPKLQTSEVAGESISLNTLTVIRYAISGETAGRMYKADYDASSLNKFYAIGAFYGAAKSAADPMNIIKNGLMTITGHGFTIGAPIFLTASGAVSSTAPSTVDQAVVRVGMVKDANTIDINIAVVGIN